MFIHSENSFSILMAFQGKLIGILFHFLFTTETGNLTINFFVEMFMLLQELSYIPLLLVLPIKLPNTVALTIMLVLRLAFCMKLPVVLMILLMVIWVFLCLSQWNCLVIISKLPPRILYMFVKKHLLVLLNLLDMLVYISFKTITTILKHL